MKNETLLDKALFNYNAASETFDLLEENDLYINLIGFLLQQSVELSVKHLLEICDINYPEIHNISKLIELLPEDKINLLKPIMLSLDGITSWEYNTRCVKGFRLEFRSVNLIMPLIEETLNNINKYCYYRYSSKSDIIEELESILKGIVGVDRY